MANPIVDLLVEGHEAQSKFEKAIIPKVVDLVKKRARPGEFFKYLKTLCAAYKSPLVGFDMC